MAIERSIAMRIDAYLIAAMNRASDWSEARLADMMSAFVATVPQVTLDWDRAAGVNWARLTVGAEVVVLAHVRTPLVILRESLLSYVSEVVRESDIALLACTDLGHHKLRAERTILEAFVGRGRLSPAIDPDQFTALDLWWTST
jgi:hypothetical protein